MIPHSRISFIVPGGLTAGGWEDLPAILESLRPIIVLLSTTIFLVRLFRKSKWRRSESATGRLKYLTKCLSPSKKKSVKQPGRRLKTLKIKSVTGQEISS